MGASAGPAQDDGHNAAPRGNGAADQEFARHQDERRTVARRTSVIASDSELEKLLPRLRRFDRIAVDTEADSLHCYFEKLCLIQITFADEDVLVDPLAPVDLQPLCTLLAEREIVLQGMDFDLRLLRRSFHLPARMVFVTVVECLM